MKKLFWLGVSVLSIIAVRAALQDRSVDRERQLQRQRIADLLANDPFLNNHYWNPEIKDFPREPYNVEVPPANAAWRGFTVTEIDSVTEPEDFPEVS